MRKLKLAILMPVMLCSPALADDNIADCEIVVQQAITENTAEGKAAMLTTYLPARDFIFSVFDAKPGFLETAGEKKIRALMCTRTTVLPTQFDLKLIETGVPLFLSQNFDTPGSAFMAIHRKNGVFSYDYSGPDLTGSDIALLKSQLNTLNTKKDIKK